MTLTGGPALERTEVVNFEWPDVPGPGVNANQFSVRWTGTVEAPSTGTYRFQTRSNDGVRLWVNGSLVIDHWTSHATTSDSSAAISLVKDQRYSVTLEMYDNSGTAVAKLLWLRPGTTSYGVVHVSRLYAN
jgi:hypothetical protein